MHIMILPPVHAPAFAFFFFLKENARKQKTLVCEKFDHLYTILEEKKREMSQKVTAEQEEKVNYIRGLTRKYGDHLEESCKIVEMGIQTMEEPEMALFLQVGFDNTEQQEEFKMNTDRPMIVAVLFLFKL